MINKKLLIGFLGIILALLLYLNYKNEMFAVNNNFITFKSLGNYGNFGNQLFQIASTLGIGEKNNLHPVFPNWKYKNYFPNTKNLQFVDDSYFTDKPMTVLSENIAGYEDLKLDQGNYDLSGYRQSELYFKNIKNKIIDIFKPDQKYLDNIIKNFPILKSNNTISVHIRRGDYVNLSDLFIPLSDEYYFAAVNYIKNKLNTSVNLIIVSDDKKWVKNNMPKLNSFSNIYYSPFNDPLDDFSVLYLCKYHINANSSFSWWASYLSQSEIVVAPAKYYHGVFEGKNTPDLYPNNWILIDNLGNLTNGMKIVSKYHSYNNDLSSNTVIVSSIYKIPSKRSFDIYIGWFKNFLQLRCNKFIFTDKNTLSILQKNFNLTLITDNLYKLNILEKYYCIIKIQELEDTFVYKKYGYYLKQCQLIDSEVTIGHNYKLYTLWNNKPFFVQDAINSLKNLNIFVKFAFWVDSGVIRSSNYQEIVNKFYNTIFMSSTKLPTKMLFSLVGKIEENDNIRYDKNNKILKIFSTIPSATPVRFEGGFFGGDIYNINEYCKMFDDMLSLYEKYKLFGGKDQNLMLNIYMNNQDFFELYYPANTETKLGIPELNDIWFRFVDYYTQIL